MQSIKQNNSSEKKWCVIIPTFNNDNTLKNVLKEVLTICRNIIVVKIKLIIILILFISKILLFIEIYKSLKNEFMKYMNNF